MSIIIAFKAFFKALKNPKQAQQFLLEQKKEASPVEMGDLSHLRMLTMLQQTSRLIDFLKEDISSFSDEQVGMAVRKIHKDSAQCIEELVTLRPVFDENEGSKIQVPQGYDPTKIKIIGKVKGQPPFTGILVHKGWKAHKRSLPKKVGDQISDVVWPAEVEIR